MGKADLHIHTTDGDGLDSVEAVVEHAERATDLDAIAVTEHDDLSTSMRARELAARRGYRLEVVTGEEVTTLQGHLVALFLERPVPSLRRIEETVEAVRAQGGICFAPHPMSWLTRSLGPATLDRLAAAGLLPDALELANRGAAGPLLPRESAAAERRTLPAARRRRLRRPLPRGHRQRLHPLRGLDAPTTCDARSRPARSKRTPENARRLAPRGGSRC